MDDRLVLAVPPADRAPVRPHMPSVILFRSLTLFRVGKPDDAPRQDDLAGEVRGAAEQMPPRFGSVEIDRQQQREEAAITGDMMQADLDELLGELRPKAVWRVGDNRVEGFGPMHAAGEVE